MCPQSAQPTISGESLPKTRFCPYCGAQMVEGFQFCDECGRQLPLKKKTGAPAPSLSEPSSPMNVDNLPPRLPQKSLREVDLTLSQKKVLKKSSSNNALAVGGNITRMFGALFGLGAIACGLLIGKNTSLSPATFAEYVLGLSVFALVLSGVSAGLRSKSVAITRRKAFELTGVAKEDTLGANANPVVDIGGIKFLKTPQRSRFIRFQWSELVRSNSLNRLVFVTKNAMINGRQPVLFLGVNETNFDLAIPGTIVTSGYTENIGRSASKKAGGRLSK